MLKLTLEMMFGDVFKWNQSEFDDRAVFTWLSKGIGFGFGFGFTTPFGWLVYLLWFWFYDSQVKTALYEYIKFAQLPSWNFSKAVGLWFLVKILNFFKVCK